MNGEGKMKKFKSIIAIVLAVLMAVGFAACGSKCATKSTTADDGAIEFGKANYSEDAPVEIGTPDKQLDADKIYNSVKYEADMFYGDYKSTDKSLYGSDGYFDYKSGGFAEFYENAPKMNDPTNKSDYSKRIVSTLPIRFEAGSSVGYILSSIKDKNVCTLSLVSKYESSDRPSYSEYYFTYEVDGNKIKLKGFDYDTESNDDHEITKVNYEFNGFELEYEFAFRGRELTLKQGDKSVTLRSGYSMKINDTSFDASAYLKSGAEGLPNINRIMLERMHDKGSKFYTDFLVTRDRDDYDYFVHGNCRMEDNGLITFTIPYKDGTVTYQFVYFFGGQELVLTDGDKTYFYTGSYYDYYGDSFGDNIDAEEKDKLGEMDEQQLQQIEEKKTDLMDDLEKEFKAEGIDVTVNKDTGELAMDSTVLFGGDSAELSAEGKAFLDKFVKAYAKIIYNDKYDGFIKKTMVEGHIAPISGTTYESGLPLSEERAKNVKDYCLSIKGTEKLKETLETKGYSQSKPVKDKDGNIDCDASRRVSFRFIINLDK